MRNLFFSIIAIFVSLTTSITLSAQDQCKPIGWATQNGGTTGGGATVPVTVTTIADLQTQAKSTGSKVIYVSGTMGAGVSTRVSVAANKTIIGLPGATLLGGFDIKANNVIIRNMKIKGPGSVDVNGVDCITIDGASNVWIDHCDIYDGQDGNMDIVNGANYVAVTWCKFYYTSASSIHQFCNLIGNSDTKTTDRGKLKVTMMYNWWTIGCVERMPRVRFGQVHVVNNYFNSPQSSYCVRAGVEADILVESNSFEGVSTPIDLYQNNFTAVTQRNNLLVSTSGNSAGSGVSFTPPYALFISPAADVKSLVTNPNCGAGATMSSPTSCGCNTSTITYTLSANANPANGGTITGAGTYTAGSVVTLTATPAAGYTFTGWSGGTTGTTTTTTVTMNSNLTVTANFQPIATTYTLTATSNPVLGGSISGAGTYNAGTVVSITATPATGYAFTGWSGGATGTSATTTVTMNNNVAVTANFQLIPVTYTLTTAANPTAGGSVTGGGTYNAGTVVTLTATPATGYTFTGWSGAAAGTSPTTTVTVNSNLTATANFQLTSSGTTSTIRIEDNATTTTGLCLVEGAISSNSGANNGKVVNLTNSIAKGVNWKVNAFQAGSYTLRWRYVNSSSSNTYFMKLIINGITVNASQPFPKTSGSTVFALSTANVNLNAGGNIIRLESIAANATADIDWIEVTGISPSAGNCTTAKGVATDNNNPMNTLVEQQDYIYPTVTNDGILKLIHFQDHQGYVYISVFSADGSLIHQQTSNYLPAGKSNLLIKTKATQKGNYFVVVRNTNGVLKTLPFIRN